MNSIDVSKFLTENYFDYGKYINFNRVMVGVDGLKPVQRRVLLALSKVAKGKLTGTVNAIGAAQVIHPFGDCLRGNTRVFELSGRNRTIEEVFKSGEDINTLAVDPNTGFLVPVIAKYFRIGQYAEKLYHIHLNNGQTITCTNNHPFLVLDGYLNYHRKYNQYKWVKAEDLTPNMVLASGYYNDTYINLMGHSASIHTMVAKCFNVPAYGDYKISEELCVHHIDENRSNNDPTNLIYVNRADHAAIHGNKNVSVTHKAMKTDPVLIQRKSERGSTVMSQINQYQSLLKALRVIVCYNVTTPDDYNEHRSSVYNAPYLETIKNNYDLTFDDLISLAEEFGDFNKKTISISWIIDKLDEWNNVKYSVEKEYELPEVVIPDKSIGPKNVKYLVDTVNSFIDNKDINLYDECGIISIQSIEIEELNDPEPMYDFTVEGYENMILPVTSNEEYPVYIVAHNSSISGVINDFARKGIINSQGDFGIKLLEDIPAAASRYTKVGLTQEQYDYFFRLLDYCPEHEGEETMEPKYFCVPVPVALVYGTLSWGLGVICRLPAFTYESLLEAYTSDDPTKLKSSYGYEIDYDNSELNKLWTIGKGRLTLKYKVNRLDYDNIIIYGSGEIFTPHMGGFNEEIERGQIIINNESSTEVVLRVSRIKGARLVDMDEMFEVARAASTNTRHYEIKLVFNDEIVNLGIKDWLDVTISNFQRNFDKFKSDRIDKINRDIELYKVLPEIGKMLIANKTNDQIQRKLKIDDDTLNRAVKKPISLLRKESFDNEIYNLNSRIENIQAEDYNQFIYSHPI